MIQKRRIFVGLLAIALAFAGYYHYGEFLTFSGLQKHRHEVLDFVDEHPRLSPLIYMGTLISVVGLTMPGATMLSFAAGLLFPQPYSTLYAWIGCVIGATLAFSLVKSVIGDFLLRAVSRNSPIFQQFEKEIKKNQVLYLVYVRFIVVIPFFFVNVSAALLGVPMHVFMLTTATAIIPGSILYTTAGSGLNSMLDSLEDGESLSTMKILTTALQNEDMQLCLVLLGVCLAVPVSIKVFEWMQSRKLAGTANADAKKSQ